MESYLFLKERESLGDSFTDSIIEQLKYSLSNKIVSSINITANLED